MPKVTAQGKTFNFPEGTTNEQIGQAVDEYFAANQVQPEEQPQAGAMTEDQFQESHGDAPDIFNQTIPDEVVPQPEPTIGEKITGAGEAALTAATGATGGSLGMMGGTLQGVISELRSGEFGSNAAAQRIADRAEKAMADLTYAPKTEAGQEYVENIGEVGAALAPLAGLGGQAAQIGQMAKAARPQVTRVVRAASQDTKAAIKPTTDIAKGIFQYQSPTKQRIAKLLIDKVGDVETAKYKLKGESPDVKIRGVGDNLLDAPIKPETLTDKLKAAIDIEGPKIVKDKEAIETIKQGFDEGVIASVKAGSKKDRSKMAKMVDIMEKGKKNKVYAVRNRPSDIAGDSLMDRVRVIRDTNKSSGKELGKVAEGLRGEKVDSLPAVNSFIDDLESIGVKITDDLKPVFQGSDIEGVVGAENVVKNIVNRMRNTKSPDAYDVHRLKKYIDEQVTYGKTTEGLTGKTESILKGLRSKLDDALDKKFPEYDRVNTTYKDTITALDSIQDVAGRKMDLSGGSADKATGTLLRRLMSNAQSRVRLLDSIDEIESIASKYGKKFDDDLLNQTLFVDELDRVFGPVARTSFQGQIDQAVKQGARAATSEAGAVDAGIGIVGRTAEKLRGVNEENAFKSIKELLKEK
ncbi:MAG: hypothetical protein V7765_21635 [Oleispira sp.]